MNRNDTLVRKAYLLVGILTIATIFAMCVARRKVEYSIPLHYAEGPRQRSIELFEKGKILFKLNCSGCHGIFKKGKDSIPDFTDSQIDNYNAMFIKGDPKSHSVARKLSQDQLNSILIFLRLRKLDKPKVHKH